MRFEAKRELLMQTADRYREASRARRSVILGEFVAATGYARKYAIRLLRGPVIPPPAPIKRPRERSYGPQVRRALELSWEAANRICSKRLVPFLPELVQNLERHGHLTLTDEVRAQLLALSPATADRLLRPSKERDRPRGVGTTKTIGHKLRDSPACQATVFALRGVSQATIQTRMDRSAPRST